MKLNVNQVIVQNIGKAVEAQPTHHVFVIDVSGSMYGSLPSIRRSLKNKLPQVTNPGDLVSLVWFSSKGQYGVLQEAVEIRSLTDFSRLNTAIDHYLVPQSLTGFREPLLEVALLVGRTKANHPNHATSMFFHTDGMDNQWGTADILSAVEAVSKAVDSAVFVEYGWYCNRMLMTQMAEKAGGANLFAEDFETLDQQFGAQLMRKAVSKRVVVNIPSDGLQRDFAFAVKMDGTVTVYAITDHQVSVPEDTGAIYYFDNNGSTVDPTAQYAALYVLAQRMDSDGVFALLRNMGDVRFINQFSTCFSRQDYSAFQQEAINAIVNPTLRLSEGVDHNAVPADDAFTVIDLLGLLEGSNENKFHPYHPSFVYERTSRATEAIGDQLTEAERDELIASITSATNAGELTGLVEKVAAIQANKITIKAYATDKSAGYPIDEIVYNEKRPNINIRVRIPYTVDLPPTAEWVAKGTLPATMQSFVFRNYTMVLDGIKHTSMRAMPFELSKMTFDELRIRGVIPMSEVWVAEKVYVINANLPVLNRQMVKAVSAKAFFTDAVQLLQAQAWAKVVKYYFDQKFERKSQGFEVMYGSEATAWLKSIGLTDYGGYAPQSKSVEPTDEYTAKEFAVKIKGCSSLPTVKAVLDKIAAGKPLTLVEALMRPWIEDHDEFIGTSSFKKASDQDALYRLWLETEMNTARKTVRRLMKEMARTKLAIMVGHTWFTEFKSLDDNTMDVNVDGVTYQVSAVLTDVTIKI